MALFSRTHVCPGERCSIARGTILSLELGITSSPEYFLAIFPIIHPHSSIILPIHFCDISSYWFRCPNQSSCSIFSSPEFISSIKSHLEMIWGSQNPIEFFYIICIYMLCTLISPNTVGYKFLHLLVE